MTSKYKRAMIKEKITKILQFIIGSITMTAGFWLIYCLIWFALNLPTTNWALFFLSILAILSECGYLAWVSD